MNRLDEAFSVAKSENRALLIGFVTAGFPSKAGTIATAKAMIAGGVDVIEVGFPYSDPVMDGPIIQRAGEIALENKTNALDVLDIVEEISNLAPTLVMTYWNPIEKFGVEKFSRELAIRGGVGLITPDLTIEESKTWLNTAQSEGLAKVFVVAPSSTDERLQRVTNSCSGFVYAASLMGVTGVRSEISNSAQTLVAKLRNITSLPIAVGLGVSNREQAAQVSKYADGVIVGSAFTRHLLENQNIDDALKAITNLAKELSGSMQK